MGRPRPPAAGPSKGFNVHLNGYEFGFLRYVAEGEGRSAQKTIKRLLVPALEAKVGLAGTVAVPFWNHGGATTVPYRYYFGAISVPY